MLAWPVRNGSGVRLSDTTYRVSSYGYNRHLHLNLFDGNGQRDGAPTNSLWQINNLCNVPVFFDCAYADANPADSVGGATDQPPPNLRGEGLTERSPQQWRFLLARHGRGINFCMADGSARWVKLEETYQLTWNKTWSPHSLRLPSR